MLPSVAARHAKDLATIVNIACDSNTHPQVARETTHISQAYTLPDGRVIKVGAERFMAAEIMFRPDLIDIEVPGVSESIFNCIQVSSNTVFDLFLICTWITTHRNYMN